MILMIINNNNYNDRHEGVQNMCFNFFLRSLPLNSLHTRIIWAIISSLRERLKNWSFQNDYLRIVWKIDVAEIIMFKVKWTHGKYWMHLHLVFGVAWKQSFSRERLISGRRRRMNRLSFLLIFLSHSTLLSASSCTSNEIIARATTRCVYFCSRSFIKSPFFAFFVLFFTQCGIGCSLWENALDTSCQKVCVSIFYHSMTR